MTQEQLLPSGHVMLRLLARFTVWSRLVAVDHQFGSPSATIPW
jgi:hypothetical protein